MRDTLRRQLPCCAERADPPRSHLSVDHKHLVTKALVHESSLAHPPTHPRTAPTLPHACKRGRRPLRIPCAPAASAPWESGMRCNRCQCSSCRCHLVCVVVEDARLARGGACARSLRDVCPTQYAAKRLAHLLA